MPIPVPVLPVPVLPTSVDALIVGAGYTGLSAARRLAKSGASVLVLDREHVGFGASSRNGGQVLTGLKLEPAALVARFDEVRARVLWDASAAAIARLGELIATESIDCDFHRTGHLQAAWKPSHFEAFRDEQALLARVFGHRVHLVSRAQQRSELGSDRYHGLLVDEESAGLNPARFVLGLADAAARSGAHIVNGVSVDQLIRQSNGWRVVTSAGTIDARDVLMATNGYADAVAPALQRRFVPVGSYIIATAPLPADQAHAILPACRMAFDSKYFLYYFRLTTDRRLLFGGRAEFGRPDADATRRAAAILRRGVADVFPELADVGIEYAWSGRVAFTRDQMPHAGRLDGVYFAGGYCGHGIAIATDLGDAIARRMAGEHVAHPLMDDRCPTIPFYRGTPWFLPIAGAYYRVKEWTS